MMPFLRMLPPLFRPLPLAAILVLCLSAHGLAQSDADRYNRAYNELHSLMRDAKRAKVRQEWKDVEAAFAEVVRSNPKGATAVKARFQIARAREGLALQSGGKADAKAAADAYAAFAKSYPRHEWAAEALLQGATLKAERMGLPDAARKDLETLLKAYPKSGSASQAQVMLSALPPPDQVKTAKAESPDGKKAAQATAKKNGEPARTAPPAAQAKAPGGQEEPDRPDQESPSAIKARPAGTHKAVLGEVRYTSSDDYTRIILDVSDETRYRYQVLAAAPEHNRPPRLYIDLLDTTLGRGVNPAMTVTDGLLQSIRSGQKDPETTRVVIDFQEMQDYKVFPLTDPYRIVVDVSAAAKPKAAGKDSVTEEAGRKPAPEATAAASEPQAPERPAKPGAKGRSPVKDLKIKGSKSMAGNLVEQLGLTIGTIMVDPGHGGKDAGAAANGLEEKDVNLRLAGLLGELLEKNGFKVHHTRTTDIFVPLEKRTAMANARKADLFISLHCNAHKDQRANGFEIYTLNLARSEDAVRVAARENAVDAKRISDLQFILTDLMLNSKMKESTDLAKDIKGQTVKTIRADWDLRDHGVREAPFYVLMGAKMPAVLVEVGYITNPKEAARLKTDQYLRQLAQGILGGVLAYKNQIERYAGI